MKFPHKVELYSITNIENDLGGYEQVESLVATIKGYISIADNELRIVDGRIINSTVTKLYTKASVSNLVDYIVADNVKYKITARKDYGKITVLEIEKVD